MYTYDIDAQSMFDGAEVIPIVVEWLRRQLP
jgi:hypothetical protein